MQKDLVMPATGIRIEAMDMLRGFALFGILAVNIGAFSGNTYGMVPKATGLTGALDTVAQFVVDSFFTSKSFTLFSFLFGLGFAVQMTKGERSGKDIKSFYPRRLLILLCIGTIHHLLLWEAEILKLYAVLGFLLLAFRHAKTRTVLAWALGLWTAGAILVTTMDWLATMPDAVAELDVYGQQVGKAFAQGNFLDAFLFRLRMFGEDIGLIALMQAVPAFTMFLFGLYVGKKGWPQRIGELQALVPCTWIAGIVFLACLFGAILLKGSIAAIAINQLAALSITFWYAGVFALLSMRTGARRALEPLASAGRCALSNYIGQSIICGILFYGYGFKLFGTLGPAACLGITLIVYAFQVSVSHAWMKRFRFGPLEWLWRSLTHGTREPILRSSHE